MNCQLMAHAFRQKKFRVSVVSCAVDSAGALVAFREKQPDIAVISAHLQDGPLMGFKVLRELRAAPTKTRVVMLLDSRDRGLIVDAFRGGADGVFSREDSLESLPRCLHAVHQGQIWANGEEIRYILEALADAVPLRVVDAKGADLLSKREEQVVRLVAGGLTNREISQQLRLSEHTIRNYLFRIFNKLGTSNRVELALYALYQATANAAVTERLSSPDPVGHTPLQPKRLL
jgi:DNA-binding NarL/FixJ family response regulator